MARYLNILEKDDSEVDGGNSEEKEEWNNPSTNPIADGCFGFQAH